MSRDDEKRLTKRQAQCVRALADGHSAESMSAALGISARTVRFHLDNAKRKLKALTRSQLVATAVRLKEID